MHTIACSFTLRKNAKRAAETMIRKGTAPAVWRLVMLSSSRTPPNKPSSMALRRGDPTIASCGGRKKPEEQPHALQKIIGKLAARTEHARPTAELLSPVLQLCDGGARLPNQLS